MVSGSQSVRPGSLFDLDMAPDLRERHHGTASPTNRASRTMHSSPPDAPEEGPTPLSPAGGSSSLHGAVRQRERAVRSDAQASCGGCDRRWGIGTNAAHCAKCHRHFGSVSGFDRHRVGGECIDPATLRTKDGMSSLVLRMKASGLTWVIYRPPGLVTWGTDADEEDDA